MAKIGALDLEKHLERVEPVPVYALVGNDEALRARSLGILEGFAAPQDEPGSSVRRFDGGGEPSDVFGELRTAPFLGMAGRRAVVVEDGDAFLKSHGEKLVAYLKSPSRTGSLILLVKRLDGRTNVARAIRSVGLEVDCEGATWNQARTWCRERAREKGKQISSEAAYALVEAVGPNVLALENELEKLVAYVGEAGSITAADVGEMTAQARSRSIYELGQAVAAGDTAESLRLCDDLLLRGERREGIIAVLARQVRQYWQLRRLAQRNASPAEMARAAGMPPFAVRKVSPVVRRLSDNWFARRLQMLSDADHESKTASLRSGEEQTWLETLLVRLCEAGR